MKIKDDYIKNLESLAYCIEVETSSLIKFEHSLCLFLDGVKEKEKNSENREFIEDITLYILKDIIEARHTLVRSVGRIRRKVIKLNPVIIKGGKNDE